MVLKELGDKIKTFVRLNYTVAQHRPKFGPKLNKQIMMQPQTSLNHSILGIS
jgi:hypothetical protein